MLYNRGIICRLDTTSLLTSSSVKSDPSRLEVICQILVTLKNNDDQEVCTQQLYAAHNTRRHVQFQFPHFGIRKTRGKTSPLSHISPSFQRALSHATQKLVEGEKRRREKRKTTCFRSDVPQIHSFSLSYSNTFAVYAKPFKEGRSLVFRI